MDWERSVTVERAKCEVERAIACEKLLRVLLGVCDVRRTLESGMDDEAWTQSMSMYVSAAEELEEVVEVVCRLKRMQADWVSEGKDLGEQLARVKIEVGRTLRELVTVSTAGEEAREGGRVESVGVLGDWESGSSVESLSSVGAERRRRVNALGRSILEGRASRVNI